MKQYRAHLLVCAGTGCVSCGAFKVKEAIEKEIQKRKLQDEVMVIATGCNGFCERGPILMVHPDGVFYQQLKVDDIPFLIEEHLLKGRPVKKLMYIPPEEKEPIPRMKDIEFFKHQRLIVLRNRGRIDPEKVEEYIAFDGYEAMAKALTEMTPAAIIDEILFSGLRGRGGAGFPTGKKWAICAKEKATPRSTRPGCSASSARNISATLSGVWLGSIMPPEPTRIRLVAEAMCPIMISGAELAISGVLWCSASQ